MDDVIHAYYELNLTGIFPCDLCAQQHQPTERSVVVVVGNDCYVPYGSTLLGIYKFITVRATAEVARGTLARRQNVDISMTSATGRDSHVIVMAAVE